MTVDRPLPVFHGEERAYFERAAMGELVFQVCVACKAKIWYPRAVCPMCLSGELRFEASAGDGSVHSYSTLYRAGHVSLQPHVPYTVGLVDLDEGVRVLGELLDPPEAIRVGLRVSVSFEPLGVDLAVPVFRSAQGGLQSAR